MPDSDLKRLLARGEEVVDRAGSSCAIGEEPVAVTILAAHGSPNPLQRPLDQQGRVL